MNASTHGKRKNRNVYARPQQHKLWAAQTDAGTTSLHCKRQAASTKTPFKKKKVFTNLAVPSQSTETV